jgi:hypothetical protein
MQGLIYAASQWCPAGRCFRAWQNTPFQIAQVPKAWFLQSDTFANTPVLLQLTAQSNL